MTTNSVDGASVSKGIFLQTLESFQFLINQKLKIQNIKPTSKNEN